MHTIVLALAVALPVLASASSPSHDDATYTAEPQAHVTLRQVQRQANPYDDAGMNGPAVDEPSTHASSSARASGDGAAKQCDCC